RPRSHRVRPRRWPCSRPTRRSDPHPRTRARAHRGRRPYHSCCAARTDARGSLFRCTQRGRAPMTATTVHAPPRRRRGLDWSSVRTVARTDLKQLIQAKDFWIPMGILGAFFFLIVPATLLLTITHFGNIDAVHKISQALDVLPKKAQDQIKGSSDAG